jgi:hypothetical protein
MRTRIAAVVFVMGCAGDGQRPETSETIETAPFSLLVCTGGDPGSPTCPFNDVSLGELGAEGSFRFTATALANALHIDKATFAAGAGGLYLEDPRIVTWPAGATTGTATTAFAGLVLNIPPNAAEPAGTAAITGEVPTRISLRFTVFDVYRP